MHVGTKIGFTMLLFPLYKIFIDAGKVTKCRFTASRLFYFLERDKSLEIVTLGFNPSHICRQFRCSPTNADITCSESAAIGEGSDACVKKTAGLRGGMSEPFSSARAVGSIARVPIPPEGVLRTRNSSRFPKI